MWYLACCDNDGKCFGFLRKDGNVETEPDKKVEDLENYKKKSDAYERQTQINLGHMLLPNGAPYRVAVVKG